MKTILMVFCHLRNWVSRWMKFFVCGKCLKQFCHRNWIAEPFEIVKSYEGSFTIVLLVGWKSEGLCRGSLAFDRHVFTFKTLSKCLEEEKQAAKSKFHVTIPLRHFLRRKFFLNQPIRAFTGSRILKNARSRRFCASNLQNQPYSCSKS